MTNSKRSNIYEILKCCGNLCDKQKIVDEFFKMERELDKKDKEIERLIKIIDRLSPVQD